MERNKTIRYATRVGLVTLGLLGTACVKPQDPVVAQINNSGQRITAEYYGHELVPTRPDPKLVDDLRGPINMMRGDASYKGGFRRSISRSLDVLWPESADRAAAHSCVAEVAAATQIPLSRLEKMSDEEGAYLLARIVDLGVALAYRNGEKIESCPFIKENLDPEQRAD